MKKCSQCKLEQPKNKFSKNQYYKDGLQHRCKDCLKRNYEKNKNEIIAQHLVYERNMRKHNVDFRIKSNLRSRLYNAIKGNYRTGSAVNDLGCSIEEFKKYIENKFIDGMSWANYGEWHLDHIIPLASFDLTNREQLLKACHYTNYQPLWALDNFKKGRK